MTSNEGGHITRLLETHQKGDRQAFDQLVSLVYDRLRDLARQQLRKMPASQTLDTVGLVHEAYLRLVDETGVEWRNRGHFYAVMARAMRWIIVDQARRRGARKRGGDQVPLPIDTERLAAAQQAEAVLAVDGAVDQLASFNERLARIVECRFFAGMTDEEIAEAQGVSVRTVQRDWRRARAWLQRALTRAE